MTGTARHQLRSRLPRGYFDNLAPGETAESWETRVGDSANDGTASPKTVQLSAGPSTGKRIAGSGEPGVICDSARHMPTPAGEDLPDADALAPAVGNEPGTVKCSGGDNSRSSKESVGLACKSTALAGSNPAGIGITSSVGLDTAEALGVTACGGPSSPQDCHEIAQQLRAVRIISGRAQS